MKCSQTVPDSLFKVDDEKIGCWSWVSVLALHAPVYFYIITLLKNLLKGKIAEVLRVDLEVLCRSVFEISWELLSLFEHGNLYFLVIHVFDSIFRTVMYLYNFIDRIFVCFPHFNLAIFLKHPP